MERCTTFQQSIHNWKRKNVSPWARVDTSRDKKNNFFPNTCEGAVPVEFFRSFFVKQGQETNWGDGKMKGMS